MGIASTAPPDGLYPWLGVPYDGNLKLAFFSPSEPQTNAILPNVPFLDGKRVWAFNHDWLLLSHDEENSSKFSLWNSNTLKSIQLPPLSPKPNPKFTAAVIFRTSDDDSSRMKVVMTNRYWRSIKFSSPLDKEWIELNYRKETRKVTDKKKTHLNSLSVCNGKLYATIFPEYYGFVEIILDLPNSSLRLQHMDSKTRRPTIDSTTYSNPFFVESRRQIYSFWIAFGGVLSEEVIGIECFKMDLNAPKPEWEEIGSEIGEEAFFLSDISSFSCSSVGQQYKGGHVYYVHYSNPTLYSFDIAHESITISELPIETTSSSSPFWMLSSMRPLGKQTIQQIPKTGRGIRVPKESGAGDGAALLNLPEDALWVILNNLKSVDYLNFRATCKACHLLAPIVKWSGTTPFPKSQSDSLCPWFMFSGNNNGVHSFIDPKLGGKYQMNEHGDLARARLRCSMFGWVLTKSPNDSLHFYNPFTKGIIPVPLGQDRSAKFGFCFSNDPSSPDCTIVGIELVHCHILKKADERWTQTQFSIPKECFTKFMVNHSSPVFHDGAVYLQGTTGNLAVLNIDEVEEEVSEDEDSEDEDDPEDHDSEDSDSEDEDPDADDSGSSDSGSDDSSSDNSGSDDSDTEDSDTEDSAFKILKHPNAPCSGFHEIFLLEWKGKLASVFIGKVGKWLKAYTLNETEMKWEKVKDIEKDTWFLSPSSCFATAAKASWMENKIFLPRVSEDDRVLFYCLETRKYGYTGTDKMSDDYNNTKEYSSSCWIQPTWNC